jgi:CRP-like cAMP-binding protein
MAEIASDARPICNYIVIGKSMDSQTSRASFRNRLLGALMPEDRVLLAPELEYVQIRERFVLETPNKLVEHVYFIEHGVASVVAVNANDVRLEAGVVGFEGMTGMAVVLGSLRSPHLTNMQLAGDARRIRADALRAALHKSASLHHTLLKYAQAFMTQTAHTALANGRAKLEVRLARWILMAHDRMDGDEVPLTHEFLSVMLGVRRAGVTVALHGFEKAGLIATRRGKITVTDRTGMERLAGYFYGVPEAELQRLLGESGAPVLVPA